MEPILISFSICVLGVMAAVLLFSVAMRSRGEDEGIKPRNHLPSFPGGFFLEDISHREARVTPASEALILELERHFRSEERAAVSFLEGPSIETLHAPSPSPLWN